MFSKESTTIGGCPVCHGEFGFHEDWCRAEERAKELKKQGKKK